MIMLFHPLWIDASAGTPSTNTPAMKEGNIPTEKKPSSSLEPKIVGFSDEEGIGNNFNESVDAGADQCARSFQCSSVIDEGNNDSFVTSQPENIVASGIFNEQSQQCPRDQSPSEASAFSSSIFSSSEDDFTPIQEDHSTSNAVVLQPEQSVSADSVSVPNSEHSPSSWEDLDSAPSETTAVVNQAKNPPAADATTVNNDDAARIARSYGVAWAAWRDIRWVDPLAFRSNEVKA